MFRTFMNQFDFDSTKTLNIGIERECFLVQNGQIVSLAPQVLSRLLDRRRFGYELSACQLEERIGPCVIEEVRNKLKQNEQEIQAVENELGFSRLYTDVAPDSMPLDVFPDPTGRYQKITKNMSNERLLAACRVAATHIHIGMPNHATALTVYNGVIRHLDRLCESGDGSQGQRLQIYQKMAPDYMPRAYASWREFHEEAQQKNFENDPRKCWHLIRLSVHGTIEFRMFGSTPEIKKIEGWAADCRSICEEVIVR